jgi:hypothetical protein
MGRLRLAGACATLALALSLPGRAGDENPVGKVPFEVFGRESASVGFVVSEPGKISVTATWKGKPLVLRLEGPIEKSLEKSGKDEAKLEYEVTAEDIKQGQFWTVTLRPDAETPVGARGNPVKTEDLRKLPVKPLATGDLVLAHPPGDVKRAKEQVEQRGKEFALHLKKSSQEFEVQAKQAVFDRAAEENLKVADKLAVREKDLRRTLGNPVKTPADTEQDTPPPVLTSISVSEGQPGTTMIITGSNFYRATEVWFKVSADRELKANAEFFNDHQIFAYVPDTFGIPEFNGLVHLKTGGKKSDAVPFKFLPATEYLEMQIPDNWRDEMQLAQIQFRLSSESSASKTTVTTTTRADELVGMRGDDQYFRNFKLKNGWIVDRIQFSREVYSYVRHEPQPEKGDAWISEVREGTDSPFVKVHFWSENGRKVTYHLSWIIRGPKGMPYK